MFRAPAPIDGTGVLIVSPTLNERENIEELINGIHECAPGAHVLLVDDGSTDGTAEVAARLGAHDGSVHILQRGQRLGIGSAYRDGFRWGLSRPYTHFISMDADLSHDPSHLPALIQSSRTDADITIGSRYLHGVSVVNWGLDRLALSLFANKYARTITGMRIRDCTSGFQCFRREVLEAIDVNAFRFTGYAFLIELKYRAFRRGFRFHEAPIIFIDRRFGSSKLGVQHLAQSIWAVWALRFGR